MAAGTFTLSDGTTNVANLLAQNAYLIGESIYTKSLNVGRWRAVTPKSALPDGVGDALTSLIYEASLPTTANNNSTVGVNWVDAHADPLGATSLNTLTESQVVGGAADSHVGIADGMSYARFNKKLLSYGLQITRIRSPWMDLQQLRTAAGLQRQVSAITEALTGVTNWTWERRLEDSYMKVAGNLVSCLAAGSVIRETVDADTDNTSDDSFYGVELTSVDLAHSGASNADITPDATISNAVLDRIYSRLSIMSPPDSAYGISNGKPVFCLICSPDASRTLIREAGILDDVRQASIVDELIKPLGVDREFRGFFHLPTFEAPRYNISSGVPVRVEPRNYDGSYNSAFDDATHEAAIVCHKEVLEAQVPNGSISAGAIKFDPQKYMGDWTFINNKDLVLNLTGDRGFFFGQLGSAIKPKHYEYGYVILYKRNSTPAA